MQKPPYGRKESFDLVEQLLINRNDMEMLEIGMTRNVNGIGGDGYSTPFFSYIANMTKSRFTSIDISEKNKNICINILNKYELLMDNIILIVADALEYLKNWNKAIDFLYLDAWDYTFGKEEKFAQCHLNAFKLIENYLKPDSLILIDDILNHQTYEGKGKYLIPYMLNNHYKLIYKGYQYLFKKNN